MYLLKLLIVSISSRLRLETNSIDEFYVRKLCGILI